MDSSQVPLYIFYGVVALFVLGTSLSGFFQVMTAEAVVVQRVGKFQCVATAGMNFKLPWLDQIAGRVDLRVQQLALDVETKTKDNVFVKIPVSVQYHVIPDCIYRFQSQRNPERKRIDQFEQLPGRRRTGRDRHYADCTWAGHNSKFLWIC